MARTLVGATPKSVECPAPAGSVTKEPRESDHVAVEKRFCIVPSSTTAM